MPRRIKFIIAFVIIAAVTTGIFLIFRPTKTITSDAKYTTGQPATSLYCYNRSSLESGLFDDQDAITPLHEIEVILYGDQLHDITYTYTGEYADHTAATTAEAQVHAAVNTKLSVLGLQESTISHNYSILDNKLITRITVADTMLTADTAPMVLLTQSTTDTLPQGLAAVESIYTRQGFICQSNNKS